MNESHDTRMKEKEKKRNKNKEGRKFRVTVYIMLQVVIHPM